MTAKIKILIVDDDLLICSGLELAINSDADMVVVDSAHDGVEAIAKAEKSKPDLILMDVQMPVMDGIACIKKIREHDAKVIILILSTFNEEQYVIEGLANGANGYLLKGGHYGLILKNIRDAIKGQYFLPIEVAAKLVSYLHNK